MNILAKVRPSVQNFPGQFNSNIFNAAIYIGFRNDFYKLKSKQTILKQHKIDFKHYGISFGTFAGIGSTKIDKYVTMNGIDKKYDGLVNTIGIAV